MPTGTSAAQCYSGGCATVALRTADGRCLDELLSSSWLYRVSGVVNVLSWHATMFVSCTQRIVASCFIVAIVACDAPAQRHAHGRIRHARASPDSIISGVFSVETAPSHRKTAQFKRRRCPFRCTARTVRRRSMPAVYLLLYRAVIRALPPVMASTSGRRFARS